MLGYCMECKKLVPIRATSRFEGGPLDYVPFPHDQPATVDANGVERAEPCDGHKRVIR